jgi:hypothetical protein
MAAPEYVPHAPAEKARVYESPPWRDEPGVPVRPADLGSRQPRGPRFGYPGPDQGFVLRLARSFEGKLALTEGESEADALSGGCAVGLRRASLFGRAPVIHDLTVALRVYGFLTDGGDPDAGLVAFRRPVFEGCLLPHHYDELRALVDRVPEWVLRLAPDALKVQALGGWQALFEPEAPVDL